MIKKVFLVFFILINLNVYSFSLLGSGFKTDLSKKITEIKDFQAKNNKALSDIQLGFNNNKTGLNDLQTKLDNINIKFDKFADIEAKIIGLDKSITNEIKNTVGGNQVNNSTDLMKTYLRSTLVLSVTIIISLVIALIMSQKNNAKIQQHLNSALSRKDYYKGLALKESVKK